MPAVAGLNFGPPATPPAGDSTVVALSGTPYGGWTQIPQPKAVYYNGKTYLGWINGSNGYVEIASYDHATATLSSVKQLRHLAADNHDAPAIWVRTSDHRILVAYSAHNGSSMYLWTSTNPEDVSAGTEANITSQLGGFANFTYPTFFELSGESKLYLLYREFHTNNRLAYSTSTDGGATWSARALIFANGGSTLPYWRVVSNGSSRFDVFITNDAPSVSSLYHLYYTGGSFYKSDGTLIDTSAGYATASQCTLVLANTLGACWSLGGSWDGSAPATVIMQATSGSDNAVKTARWRSGAWQLNTVVASVGGHLDSNTYASGCAMSRSDPDVLLISKLDGTHWEMFRYTSADDGSTWTPEQLTAASSVDNVWPDFVSEADTTKAEAVWLRGTYTSDTSYSWAIQAEHQ